MRATIWVVPAVLFCTSMAAHAANQDLFVADLLGLYRVNGTTGSLVYDNRMGETRDVTFGPDGNAYVSTGFGNTVVRVNPSSGAPTGTFATGLAPPPGGDQNFLSGLAFGPDGNLYVGSLYTGNVLRFNGVTGAPMGVFTTGGDLGEPRDVLFGPDGNLYVSDFFRVLRYDGTTGAFMGVFAASKALFDVNGLTFGPDGNLYVAGTGSDNIVRFAGNTGAFIDIFASELPGSLIESPWSLAFGSDGNLYVAAEGAYAVERLDGKTGAYLGTFSTVDPNHSASGIAFAPVPEPAGLGVVALAGGLLARRRRC